MRLIDADRYKAYMQDKYILFDNTLADIDAQPTVDAEPIRHGHWVQGKESARCSECNCTLAGQALWTYCPHCGAKMDEVL